MFKLGNVIGRRPPTSVTDLNGIRGWESWSHNQARNLRYRTETGR